MGVNRHIYILTFTLTIIVVSVVSTTIYVLYNTALNVQKQQLSAFVKSQAKLIESVAYFDSVYSNEDVEGGATQATLSQISKAYEKFEGFGETGEINIAKLDNKNVVFILQSRLLNIKNDSNKMANEPISIGSQYAIPMQKALMGESGTIIGLDYDGVQVLAAYEPINGLNYGIVVKIDLGEVRNPFVNSAIVSAVLALILTVIGAYVFMIINNRSIRTLKNSEEKLREAQKIANVGSWELDIIRNELKWSDEIYRIFNLKPQEFDATYEAFLKNIHPDDRDMVNKAYSESLIDKKPYNITHRLKLEDGTIKYVRESCETSFNKHGEPQRSIGTVQDITEIKLAEIELNEYKNHLEAKVVLATNELTIKNKALKKSYLQEKLSKQKLEETNQKLMDTQVLMVESEKMASLGQLTAGISHEINNPINFISAGINSLEENLKDVLGLFEICNQMSATNYQEKIIEINDYKEKFQFDNLIKFVNNSTKSIKSGTERTTEIIEGLRIFSHNDLSKMQRVDINRNLNATLTILHSQYSNNGIEVIKDYGALPLIQCYSGSINQVFSNIIGNAIHAISDCKKSKKGKITISTERHTNGKIDEVVIKIKDNGKGIATDVQKRIFEPFYTTKEVGKGTGLGLSISYGIIKNHKGRILVNSTEGKGSEFAIYLPISNS